MCTLNCMIKIHPYPFLSSGVPQSQLSPKGRGSCSWIFNHKPPLWLWTVVQPRAKRTLPVCYCSMVEPPLNSCGYKKISHKSPYGWKFNHKPPSWWKLQLRDTAVSQSTFFMFINTVAQIRVTSLVPFAYWVWVNSYWILNMKGAPISTIFGLQWLYVHMNRTRAKESIWGQSGICVILKLNFKLKRNSKNVGNRIELC